jgi:DNA-binding XRE family transcriptional regulator
MNCYEAMMRNGLLGHDDIKMWRAKHDLSQTAAAPFFGVSRSRLRDFESGYRPPKDLHERILAAFIRFYGLDALARGVDKGRDSGRRAFERARADIIGVFERELRPYPLRG